MNLKTARQAKDKHAQASATTRIKVGNSDVGSAADREVDPGDLQAQIAMQAYELYVQRGCREDCAVEDWLDAEREMLTRNKSW